MSSEKVKYIKLKNGETFSESIPLSTNASNVDIQKEGGTVTLDAVLVDLNVRISAIKQSLDALTNTSVDKAKYNEDIENIEKDISDIQNKLNALNTASIDAIADRVTTLEGKITGETGLEDQLDTLSTSIETLENQKLDTRISDLEDSMEQLTTLNYADKTYEGEIVKSNLGAINPALGMEGLDDLQQCYYYVYIEELSTDIQTKGIFKVYFPAIFELGDKVKVTIPMEDKTRIYIDEIPDASLSGNWFLSGISIGTDNFKLTSQKRDIQTGEVKASVTNLFNTTLVNGRITSIKNPSTGQEIVINYES